MAEMLTLISPRLVFFLLAEQNENSWPLPPAWERITTDASRHMTTMTTATTTNRVCTLGSKLYTVVQGTDWAVGAGGVPGPTARRFSRRN